MTITVTIKKFIRHAYVLPFLAFAAACPAKAAPMANRSANVVYLDCTGTMPVWTGSWADQPAGMGSDKAKLVIRLDLVANKATVPGLFGSEDFVFDLKSQPEWYYGSSGNGTLAHLDGQIVGSNISLNRINGGAFIGFEVRASPKNGPKVAFSGTCDRGAVKF